MAASQGSLPNTKDVVTRVFGDMKEYSKLAGQIPSEDYDYHQAFPGFRKQVAEQSATLVQLMDACTQLLPKRRRVPIVATEDMPSAASLQLSEAKRTAVMEAVDSLLESVDTVLDDLRGRKMSSVDQLSVTFGSELVAAGGAPGAVVNGVTHIAQVMRPQLTFETPVDNSDTPFVPVYYDAQGAQHTGSAREHPFAELVSGFAMPPDQLLPKTDTPSVPLPSCPLTFVDTAEALQRVVQEELLNATEIAVDLEHHDFYSYQGFTCLMQLSTRTADYIVDCLRLRSSMHLLAPVFLNPNILKVLHGAREDVRWLQKDFSLYLVNFFDTGIALQTLHMPYSLAFAVDHFCQVKLNKKYQTADWRVRPLSAEMVHYARQDTHFLLYIYDRLKALLLNSENRASVGNLLVHVFNESRRLSLELYEKPHLLAQQSYKAALGRSLGGLSPTQERVAREVFNWRDAAAREADDSPTAVMHLSSVLAIASKLPTTARDLMRCCSPVSVVLRRGVGQLVELVKAAVGNVEGEDNEDQGARTHHQKEGSAAVLDASLFNACRPIGVYRPMTGALPSISTRAAPAVPTAATASVASMLSHQPPSVWFQAMQAVATSIARHPPLQIPVPGSEVLAKAQASRQRRLAEAKAKAEEDAAAAAEARATKRARVETKSGSASSASDAEDNEEEGEETEKMAVVGTEATQLPEAEDKIDLPAGAFSMRQQFGTGAQDRKKAKSTAAKKGKGRTKK